MLQRVQFAAAVGILVLSQRYHRCGAMTMSYSLTVSERHSAYPSGLSAILRAGEPLVPRRGREPGRAVQVVTAMPRSMHPAQTIDSRDYMLLFERVPVLDVSDPEAQAAIAKVSAHARKWTVTRNES